MKTKKLILAIVAVLMAGFAIAQNESSLRGRYQYFNNDSLVGFDEDAARRSAIHEGFLAEEFTVRMNQLKRQFINNKFNLWPKPKTYTGANTGGSNLKVVPACVNEDFEASTPGQITSSTQVNGWVVTSGSHTINANPSPNSCNLSGCCDFQPTECEIINCSSGYVDNVIGAQYPIYSVFGTAPAPSGAAVANPQITSPMSGTTCIRINSSNNNYSIARLSKTFNVTNQNALFQFAFISVFATGHGCCDAGAFKISLSNATNNTPIACPNFTVSAPGSGCMPGANSGVPNYFVAGSNTQYTYNASSSNGYLIYNKWTVNSMDLSSYIGQNITIDIVTSDCTAGGHYGYIYFDAQCGPMTLIGNGTPFPAGSGNVTVPTCGASGATVCAPAGLGPYWWAGPNLNPMYTTPSMTNQCFISNLTAQYTLYMNPAGACLPITRVVNTTITPAPLLLASIRQAQCGDSLAIISVTPSGSATTPSIIVWSPTPKSLNTATTVGVYRIPGGNAPNVVAVSATDPLGCPVVTTLNVNPAPPIPSFTIQNLTGQTYITCKTPSVTLNAHNTYTYGTLSYFWATPTATSDQQSVDVTAPGNVTITVFDAVTNCVITKTTAITINTAVPVGNVSPQAQLIGCTATPGPFAISTTPTINVKHTIYNPDIYGSTVYSVTTNPSFLLNLPTAPGTYTDIITNEINGCKTVMTFTLNSNEEMPTFSLITSAPGFSLGCGSKSVSTITFVNPQLGQGGPVTQVILPIGSTPGGNLSFTTAAAGTYTALVKASNSTGCETRLVFSILNNKQGPPIDTVFIERNILTCANPTVNVTGHSDSTNVSYEWTYGSNLIQSNSVTVSSNTAAPNTTLVANYTLTVKDLNNTCITTTVVPILQNLSLPAATVFASNGASLSCTFPRLVLNFTGLNTHNFPTKSGVVMDLWNGPSPQEPLLLSTSYTAATPGQYTATVRDLDNGCKKDFFIHIGDNIKFPIINQSLPSVLDCGSNSVVVSPEYGDPDYKKFSFAWTTEGILVPPANQSTVAARTPGLYHVVATNTASGCRSEMDVSVVNGTLNVGFDPDITEGFMTPGGKVVTFENKSRSSDPVSGTASVTAIWNFGNNNSATITPATSATIKNVSNRYTQPGNYTVTLWASKGSCTGMVQKVIRFEEKSSLTVPNIFTPNNDGINDVYWLKATNLSDVDLQIFDRWGHLVYSLQTNKGQVAWDGNNQYGKPCSEGVYFYVLKATGKDGEPYESKGNITLAR